MRVNNSHLDINILQDNSIIKSLWVILIKNTYEQQTSEELPYFACGRMLAQLCVL